MNKQKLLKALELCKLAISKESPLTNSFWFEKNQVHAFDGDLGVVATIDSQELEHTGIASGPLLAWLKSQTEETVSLITNDETWTFKCGDSTLECGRVIAKTPIFTSKDRSKRS